MDPPAGGTGGTGPGARAVAPLLLSLLLEGCGPASPPGAPLLSWHVFREPSGAFEAAAQRCAQASAGHYRIALAPLPTDADQQREQLARRLAAGDEALDLIGMDVVWTAEFAEAGWIRPWPDEHAGPAREGRIPVTVATGTYRGRLWAAPFTTNAQLLWYRTDRVEAAPATWDAMIRLAETLGPHGRIQVQGERYEGLTVFFTSLLASAGGSVLAASGAAPSLAAQPTSRALEVMRRLATSPAADPALATRVQAPAWEWPATLAAHAVVARATRRTQWRYLGGRHRGSMALRGERRRWRRSPWSG